MLAPLALASTLASPSCDEGGLPRRVHATQTSLFAIPEGKDDLPYDAPPAAQNGVPALRVALSAAITSFMQCDAPDVSDPMTIQAAIAKRLNANQPKSAAEQHNGYPDHTYGDDLTIQVKPFSKARNTVAVDASFSISCGDDHTLLLFRHEAGGWQRILDWHSDKYTQPSDSFGDFFLYAPVPGVHGTDLVVVAYGTPWCTSRMSVFHIDLVQPASANSNQKLLDHLDEGYSRLDHAVTLHATLDGFQLRAWDDSLDFDNLFTRPRIFHYRTISGHLERTQPVANNARDFVDVWLQRPWSESSAWTASPSPELRAFRDRFDYKLYDSRPELTFGAVRACGNQRFQVEFELGKSLAQSPSTMYAVVQQNPNSFIMLSIQPTPAAACSGPDIMRQVR